MIKLISFVFSEIFKEFDYKIFQRFKKRKKNWENKISKTGRGNGGLLVFSKNPK